MSNPNSRGLCTAGDAKVLSATVKIPRSRPDAGDSGEIGDAKQRIAGRLDPDHSGQGRGRGGDCRRVAGVHLGDREPRSALTHAMEKTPGSAIKVVRGDNMGAPGREARAPQPPPRGLRRKQSLPRRFRVQRATPRTRARVGLPEREYSQPVFTPGEDCTKVAVAKIGVTTAPVSASRFCRPWSARVEKPACRLLSLVIVAPVCPRR